MEVRDVPMIENVVGSKTILLIYLFMTFYLSWHVFKFAWIFNGFSPWIWRFRDFIAYKNDENSEYKSIHVYLIGFKSIPVFLYQLLYTSPPTLPNGVNFLICYTTSYQLS